MSLRIAKQLYSSYVNVVNFDRYNMIIGTLFMRKHGVLLDFKKSRVIINDMELPAIRVKLRDSDARLRHYWAMDKKKKQEWLEAAASAIGRTTAATVATSELVEHTHKVSIEEIEDENDIKMKNRKTLLANGRYTLMTESKYMEDMTCSEGGENATTKAKFAAKSRENHEKHQPKTNHREGVDITNECEPTSSKVKVEELVNDEEVELTNDDLFLESIDRRRQLFNQPIPLAETYHIYNPRNSMRS